jgi:quercetin dioxygenase-like cupin family protein
MFRRNVDHDERTARSPHLATELTTGGFMPDDDADGREPVILSPGDGRAFEMGRIRAVFKADGAETGGAYSISEWWMAPHCTGPGGHVHPEDDVFYVTEGTMTIRVGDEWIDAPKGSFVLVPGGVTHDFENRSSDPAGFVNFSQPGNFEQEMPGIAQWFIDNPPGDPAVRP